RSKDPADPARGAADIGRDWAVTRSATMRLMSLSPSVAGALVSAAQATPGLELLMLFGSRARDTAHAGSDWDFAYLARERMDASLLLATLVEILASDRIDLVDL